MTTNQRILLRSTPSGLPTPDDFQSDEVSLAPLSDNQVRCQTETISLDPYIRSVLAGNHMGHGIVPGELVPGETVSIITESDHPEWPVGTRVRAPGGWQTYSSHDPSELARLPEGLTQSSLVLSTLGMPGLTAFAGMHRLAEVTAGDTVVIPAAVGGVGAMAAQLARLSGARTIAITSGEVKRRIALDHLCYDHCIDRKEDDVDAALAELAPDGVSVYFDLVGDPLLTQVSQQLAIGGRVILCGLIGDYSGQVKTLGPPPGLWIFKRAIVKGLVVYDFEHERSSFEREFTPLVEQGKIVGNEEVHRGLASAPEAFCRLMRGDNTGKVIVTLTD